ncbi:MAG: ABC transporter ATP-binding protein [Clostridia bacterium]|nr:ABC transporter ATP-binding protein [Clostridia bacterium]
MGDNIVEIKDISYSYQRHLVLKEVNIDFPKGKFISILGPNGSGKTTLLKNISGALRPDYGTINIDKRNLNEYSKKELAKKVAFVPQNTSINFDFSVYDMVLMGRTPYIERLQNEKIEDLKIAKKAMEQTSTWQLKDRFATQLSGGEMQRVVAARAIAQQPEIILLDEPTSHLDVYYQLDLLELMHGFKERRNLTVIAVLHDINLAAQFSDLIVLIKEGEIVGMGPAAEIVTEKNIKQVYGIDCFVSLNPITKSPYVLPYGKSTNNSRNKSHTRFHIICGGGSGSNLMEKLYDAGYPLSAGVLNIGDTDWNTGKILGIDIAEELPFSPISSLSFRDNLKLIHQSDVVVLSDLYFGEGNVKNIEILFDDSLKDVHILALYDKISDKDYTGNKVTALYDKLKQRKNVLFFTDEAHLISFIKDKYN